MVWRPRDETHRPFFAVSPPSFVVGVLLGVDIGNTVFTGLRMVARVRHLRIGVSQRLIGCISYTLYGTVMIGIEIEFIVSRGWRALAARGGRLFEDLAGVHRVLGRSLVVHATNCGWC